jgi:hypothetical protein
MNMEHKLEKVNEVDYRFGSLPQRIALKTLLTGKKKLKYPVSFCAFFPYISRKNNMDSKQFSYLTNHKYFRGFLVLTDEKTISERNREGHDDPASKKPKD